MKIKIALLPLAMTLLTMASTLFLSACGDSSGERELEQSDSELLMYAAEHGDLDEVKRLIEKGTPTELSSSEAWYAPLWRATERQRVEVARYLINAGANVQLRDTDGNTLIHEALMSPSGFGDDNSRATLTKMFLDLGVDGNARNKRGWTAWYQSACVGLGSLDDIYDPFSKPFSRTRQVLLDYGVEVYCYNLRP